MKLSKNLTSGCLVQILGDKVCRVNNQLIAHNRIAGIYHPNPTIITAKTRLFNGELHTVSMDIPAGIRIGGFDQVECKEKS